MTNEAQAGGRRHYCTHWWAGAGGWGVPLWMVTRRPTRALCADREEPRLRSVPCLIRRRDQVSWVGP